MCGLIPEGFTRKIFKSCNLKSKPPVIIFLFYFNGLSVTKPAGGLSCYCLFMEGECIRGMKRPVFFAPVALKQEIRDALGMAEAVLL